MHQDRLETTSPTRLRIALLGAVALAALATAAPPLSAQSVSEPTSVISDLEAEIDRLDAEISASRTAETAYSGGALAALAAVNTQTLELTRSVLEARLAAERTGAPIEITVPAVAPDPDLARELLAEMASQQARLDATRAEAEAAGGLVEALTMTRYEVERVTLAQLRQAWLRARYGIAFPALPLTDAPASTATDETVSGTDAPAVSQASPAWADANHPEIDYTAQVFSQLNEAGYEIVGWWGLQRSTSPIDDSPQIIAINVSDWGSSWSGRNPSLKVGCVERETRVVYDVDTYLLADTRTHTLPVTLRIDDAAARAMTWSKVSDSHGAGLFGAEAEDMIRTLQDAERLFLRVTESNNINHDIRLDLAGTSAVFAEVAETCQFSLLDLSPEDYRTIQTLLNAGGFDAGTPDGVWGPGSRAAMTAFQAANGLEQTGAPDEATLSAMGID